MGTSNYSDEFKRDAVQQIRVRGFPVREVSLPAPSPPHVREEGGGLVNLNCDHTSTYSIGVRRWRGTVRGMGFFGERLTSRCGPDVARRPRPDAAWASG